METHNMHIANLCRWISRYLEEISKSASAGVTALSNADKRRMLYYIDSTKKYLDHILGLQKSDSGEYLDLPESHPTTYTLAMPDPVGEMENNTLIDVCEYFKAFYTEALNSQSSRLASGLLMPDSDRLYAILQALDVYINDFVMEHTPADFPESSPRAEGVKAGKTGIRRNAVK